MLLSSVWGCCSTRSCPEPRDRRFRLGDEGDARREDVGSKAPIGQGDGGERGGLGVRYRRGRGFSREKAVTDRSVYRAEEALLPLYWWMMTE